MIDDGDKLKEKRQKGGNENTEAIARWLWLLQYILIGGGGDC